MPGVKEAVMTTAATVRLVLAGLMTALLVPAAGAQNLDSLNEEMRVETARLEYALEKVQKIRFPVTGDDLRARKALLKEGRFLMKQAAQVPSDAPNQIEEITALMEAKRVEARRFMEEVKPLWAEQTATHSNRGGYRSAYAEVLKFHDVQLDAESVLDHLTADEAARVAELRQTGENLVAQIKTVRESDHRERDRLVGELMKVREELQALHGAGQSDRRRGYSFVAQSRTHHAWTEVHHVENGFEAMRTRFVSPGTAYVTLKNLTDEARHVFVELEFFTSAGDSTGEGVFETASLEEFRPGEVREILVPIYRSNDRFWTVTRSYTIYLD